MWLTAEGSATGEDLRLWDTTSWKKLAGYRYAKSVAWSPDSSFVAVSGYKTLFIWDVAKKQIVLTLSGYTDDVRGVAWSPDGKWLTSVGKNEKVVRIWDVTTGQTVHELNWEEMLSSVAWSPDGKSLAAGGRESIPIWDVSSSQLQAVLKGQAGGVNSLAWSPNGRWLAAASSFNEPMVRVWDVNSQALAYVLTGHTDDVTSVAWSPDGKRLATGSKDGTVRVWAMH